MKNLTISYRNKLLLSVLPLLLIGFLSLTAGVYWYSTETIQEELMSSFLTSTSKTAEGLDLWCRTVVIESESIAATVAAKKINSTFEEIDAQNITRKQFLEQAYPDLFQDIYAANREGIYHSALLNEKKDGNEYIVGDISDRPYFKSIMNGGGAQLTPLLVSRSTGLPSVFAVAPILDEENKPQGLIGAGISLEYVNKIAQNLRLGKTGYGMVVAKDGTFIYHPRSEFVMKKQIYEFQDETIQELGRRMQNGGAGILRYQYEGQKKIAFYQPVPFAGWSVATTILEDELLEPIYSLLKFLAVITLATLLLVGGSLWLAARQLTKPLHELDLYARQVGEGRLDLPQLPVVSQDEVGRLTEAFNKMTDTVRQMVAELAAKNEELKEANELLERRVEEKTQELTAANQELLAMNEEMGTVNAKLEEEVEMRRQAGERLLLRERQYRVATNLVTRPVEESSQCLVAILQNALDLVNAPDGYIGLYDIEANLFSICHAVGLHTLRQVKSFPLDVGLQGTVYAKGEATYLEDYRKYARRIDEPCLQNVTSVIMLPLKRGGVTCGVFAASWEWDVHPVGQEDIEVMRQFADLASVLLERAQNHDHIHHMAFHDMLTNLPNRVNMEKMLEQELKRAQKEEFGGALFFVDLDDLKAVNDNFGHSSGDSVIRAAGRHMVEAVGSAGVVSRQGGDEFIALLPRIVSREEVEKKATQVITELSREYEVAGKKLHLTASLGVVFYPEDGLTVEDVLKKADSAMYAAKKAGRNCWRFFEHSLSQEAYERLSLTNSLRRALEKQELFLQYQPQLDLRSGKVSGFEALLRWRSDEHGLVSPAKFIPIAEESGLILPIGAWVLQEACRFARELAEIGLGHVHIAVNISPKQLVLPNFVEQVRATLEREVVNAEQIVLEVTEGIMIESMKESIHKLWELRKMGLLLALDDFGTGYSSLTYLKHLPINILKMDKSFIDAEDEKGKQEEMIASIIALGHTLEMTIVAEGVETDEQEAMLKRCNCDCVQGYIFSRPVNKEDALKFLC